MQDVMNATAALGMAGMQLSGLDAENDLGGNTLSSGAAATAGTSANTGRSGSGAPEADEALLLAQLREQLLQRSRQLPSPPDIITCLKVSYTAILGFLQFAPSILAASRSHMLRS